MTLFAFLAAAARLRSRIAKTMERLGVSAAEYELLARLRAGAWCGVQDVPADLLEKLALKGAIRRIDSEPNRTRVARITPIGRDLLDECDIHIEVVRATFAARFTAAERTALNDFLSKMH